MIPIYYDGTTGLQGNGLGALRDAIYCTVTEERNGSYELEMQYPITGQHYDSLAMRGLVKAKPNPYSEAQYFRIYKISRPINGLVTINAQHISYDLSGVPVAPFTASTAALAVERLKTNAAVDCPFTIWTDLSTAAEFANAKPASLRSLLGGVDGSILDVYGGEYEWDNYTVKLHARRGADRGVTIRYGKNLTDLTQEENCANVYTGVYPYWVDDEGGVVQISGAPIVNVPDGQYDFTRIMTLDVSQDYNEQPTDDQLKQAALDYIKANDIGVPKVSLSISFAQLEQTEEYKGKALLERVCLCDTVHVSFERLGVDATARVIKTIYNVLLDRYDSVELGSAKSTLAGTVASLGKDTKTEIDKTKSMLQEDIDRATQLITGNLGGYVILHSSTGSDAPDEILVMDQPDINTATKVWRWNKSGLGYSSTGYNGPYGLAMTQDGAIVADFITAGTLNAALIRAGVLQDKTGKVFKLDLDGGTLDANFNSLKISGRSTEEISKDIANDVTDGKLKEYSTTVQMNSAIEQSASSIKLEVSENYATTVYVDSAMTSAVDEANNTTDGKLTAYSTTVQMQSAIEQSAKKISLSVKNNGTSSVLTLSYDGTTLSSQNVEITGFVTFSSLSTSGQSTINGDNITTGTIRAQLTSVSSEAGTVKIYSGGVYAYDKNGTYRIGLFTASSTNNTVLQFKDSSGSWCGDLFGYRDNGLGIFQLNVSENGFFRTNRIQTQEIAIGGMKCFCDGYRTLDGNAFVYLDGSARVGCFEKLAIAGAAAQDVRWVWSTTLGGWLLTTATSLN